MNVFQLMCPIEVTWAAFQVLLVSLFIAALPTNNTT